MADISKINSLDGNTTYNIKDATARTELEQKIEYVIVNELPSSNIDEQTVYLVPATFTPGAQPLTYTLSRANNTITLTGSDSSTSSVDGGLTQSAVEDLIDTTINNVLGVAY